MEVLARFFAHAQVSIPVRMFYFSAHTLTHCKPQKTKAQRDRGSKERAGDGSGQGSSGPRRPEATPKANGSGQIAGAGEGFSVQSPAACRGGLLWTSILPPRLLGHSPPFSRVQHSNGGRVVAITFSLERHLVLELTKSSQPP